MWFLENVPERLCPRRRPHAKPTEVTTVWRITVRAVGPNGLKLPEPYGLFTLASIVRERYAGHGTRMDRPRKSGAQGE